jgi:mRNA interferase RelE/StbE
VSAPWRVEITPSARRELRRLDPPVRARVTEALERVAADPHGAQLRRISGRTESRLRVGDWRVRLELDTARRAIVVHHVLPRGRVYDR